MTPAPAWPGRVLAAVLHGCVLAPLAAEPQPGGTSPQATDQSGPGQSAATPWLDEVKRQRQAWEERRDSARQALEERRRRQDRRGSAQQQAWQEGVRRRREARLEQMEQEREYFRNLAPYQNPPWAPPIEPPSSPLEPGPKLTQQPGKPSQAIAPPTGAIVEPPAPPPPPTPPDWDNLWYYRGF